MGGVNGRGGDLKFPEKYEQGRNHGRGANVNATRF